MTLPLKFNDLNVPSERTPIDRTFFNRRFLLLFSALDQLDKRMATYDSTVNTLVTLGLERLNEALGPMLTILQEASELSFLVAKAIGNSVSLVEGEPKGFMVTEGAALFTPTPYLLAQDITDETNWGIVSLDDGGWTKETGDLAVHVVYATKTQASTQWVLSASGATLPAMRNVLADVMAIQTDINATAATVASDVSTLQDLIDAVADGPVASVAGRTGVIVLAISDIIGLTEALAAKASTTALTIGLATKQDASAKLLALHNATWATDKLQYFTDASHVSSVDFKAWARNFVGAADNAAGMTSLGLQSWAQGFITAANLAAGLTALGIPSYFQTLFGNADLAALKTALGIAAVATATDVRASAGAGFISPDLLATAADFVTLTDAATILLDWDTFINGTVTITANRILGNPTHGKPGESRSVLVKGSSTTDRTLTFGNQYLNTPLPVLTTIDSGQWYRVTIECISATHFTATAIKVFG